MSFRGPKALDDSVAVEKVAFFKNRLKLGDRKCLPDPRRSFIAHPDAFYFCEFHEKEFFNSHRLWELKKGLVESRVGGSAYRSEEEFLRGLED